MNDQSAPIPNRIVIRPDGKLDVAPMAQTSVYTDTFQAKDERIFQFSTHNQNGVYAGWSISVDGCPASTMKEMASGGKEVSDWIVECLIWVRGEIGEVEFDRVHPQLKSSGQSHDWVWQQFQK